MGHKAMLTKKLMIIKKLQTVGITEDIDRIAVTADTYLITLVDTDLVMAATSLTTADIVGTSRITVDTSLAMADMVDTNRISVAMEGINLTMVTEDSDHMAAAMVDTDTT